MLDRISITGLRVRGYHGVLAHERAAGQDFVVDAVLWLDAAPAAAADDLSLTADYGALADRLAAECLGISPVQAAEVTVHKPQAPVGQEVADIAVTIRREVT